MKFIDTLEKKFRRFAIPNLTLLLVASQSLCFILALAQPLFVQDLFLIPDLVINGEVWRLITFMIVPPGVHPILAIFVVYVFYLMGTSLEEEWGIFRYNLYLAIAYIATVIAVFAGPGEVADNLYIQSSVFLAFAFLYPEFEFLLFFVLPVKVKYLAMFTWTLYAFQFLFGSGSQRMMIIASTANFFIFFGTEIRGRIRARQRKLEFENQVNEQQQRYVHQCEICKTTDVQDGEMEFRICSQCKDGQEYCSIHIHKHEHI